MSGVSGVSGESVPSATERMSADEDCVHIVTIEGGIGVGKSTVMDAVRKARPSLTFVDEPVAVWEKTGLLECMYNDTVCKGTFQIAALATRFAPLFAEVRRGTRLVVTERCPWSDMTVFTKANLEAGSVDMRAYTMAFDALMTALPSKIHLHIVYLRTEVDTQMERIRMRGRPAERMDSAQAQTDRREYLERLEKLHNRFFTLTEHELGVASCSRHVIDAGSPASQVAQEAVRLLSEIAPVKIEPQDTLAGGKRRCGQ